MKGKDAGGRWAAGLIAVLAALLILAIPFAWFPPFWAMPRIPEADLRARTADQLRQDAAAGHFSVVWDRPESLRVDSLRLASGAGFQVASGDITTDRGTFPYTVPLKKVPLSHTYLYDTRYRLAGTPTRIEGMSYFQVESALRVRGETVEAENTFRYPQFLLLCLALYPLARLAVLRRRKKKA